MNLKCNEIRRTKMSKDQVKDELAKIFKTSLTAEVVHCFITTVLFRVAKR